MSREIDERIVAMYFDNEQFEKNARQSMKTLDELKQGLDFEGVGESFQQVQKMTSKGFGMKDSTKQVGFFSKALTGMGKAAKSAFNVATMPIQALGNGLKTLEGYVGKVLGFNLASKLVNTGETVIRAFTIDPMRSGWNEYELKMDSIKTIMSGTTEEFKKQMGAAYTESAHLEAVKDALEQLNKYADQTVYSFSDMTSNIGKFTNNGVKLEDAVMAMKGISNAAAQAGQGTQQASMAMYNLSQAISVGKLTTMDWKSIENANMATQQFKQTFIDMAAAMGKLEKKGDQYFTTTKKHMEVTAENFRNTLSEGWADSDVITAALKVWSGDYKAVQLVELGVPEELAWEMERLGQAAFDAATQVRTFTKMWDALKEAAQSGWSMSWEYIFGDMNEATEMWTNFNNRFSGWLESSAKARNDLLKGWRGEIVESDIGEALNDTLVEWDKYEYKDWYKEGGLETLASAILEDFKKNNGDIDKAIEHIRKEYGLTAEDAKEAAMKVSDVLESGALGYVGTDGRSTLIAGINNLLDGFENIGRLFGKIKTAVFGEMTPELLQNLTQGFANLTERFKNFTAELGSGKVFKNITTGLKGIASLFTMLWNSIKSIGSFALKMLSPVGEFFSDLFAGVGEWLTSLSGGGIVTAIKKIVDGFKNLTKVKVADWFKKAATSVGNLFKNLGGKASGWFKENGFEKVGDMIANVTSSISSAWNRVIGWKGWSDIGAFFSDALGWIVKTYGKAKSAVISLFGKGEDGGPSAVAKAVSDAYAVIENAWNEVFGEGGKGKEIIDKIGNFFVNTYHSIISLFTPIEGANGEKEPSPAMTFLTNVGTTLENAWKAAFGEGSKGKEIIDKIGNFFVNTYHSIVALFTPIEGANGETEPSPAIAFLTNVGTTLENAWNKVFGENGKGKEIVDKIGNFFVNTYHSIISLFTPIEGANGEQEPSPAMAFLTNVGTTLENAWNGVFGEGAKGEEVNDKMGNFFVNT
jgi:tape measure domain-containing protein